MEKRRSSAPRCSRSAGAPTTGIDRRRLGSGSVARAAMLLAFVIAFSGCGTMWDNLRERERIFSLETARTQTGRGQCAAGLGSLDRAQARIDLGLYSRESTLSRARCYEKLGRDQLAAAHRRLIEDFYTDEPMAFPSPDGSSVFRAKEVSLSRYELPPRWLKIPAPRYSAYARRSKIIGRVIVSFEFASNDKPKSIRVLEMSHPLLATWAIEAVSLSTPKRSRDKDRPLMPGGRYVTAFNFSWRWAEPGLADIDEL